MPRDCDGGDVIRGRRKICVVTGSRAEFGLLRPLLENIRNEKGTELQLLVTGSHLSERFGLTVDEIAATGFDIDARVKMDVEIDTPLALAQATGHGLAEMATALDGQSPDIVVLLGDRYEIFAAAEAAFMLGVPIAHIHGGEVTEAAFDDSFRHAITKFSALHFTAAEEYRRRVIQMGEEPSRVFNVGALAADGIPAATRADRTQLEESLGVDLTDPIFLITYHPVTLRADSGLSGIKSLLEALNGIEGATFLFTGVNADPGNGEIDATIQEFVDDRSDRAAMFQSMGRTRYLSVMALSAAVVGNSSSGIIEAPILKVPTVNIGDRQKGRLRVPSIIDCRESVDGIADALVRAMDQDFRTEVKNQTHPYGGGDTAHAILERLRDCDLSNLRQKGFHDIPGDYLEAM